MNTSFFGELLQTISERGRALLARDRRGESFTHSESLVELCEELLSGRGEASGVALAREILAHYSALTTGPRIAFFEALAQRFGTAGERLDQAIRTWQKAPSDVTAADVHAASEPRRQELFRRLNLAPGGTAALVRMREQLLDALDHRRDDLAAVDADFVHLFSSWFNRGFLVLRHIDWSTPAIVLEKIIRYEAVHEIRGWDDLRRRIDPPDRRCYAFFHPALIDEPLIFVEVALERDIPGAIAPILASGRQQFVEPEKARIAVFYSISNCQRGLSGVSFGNFLIKQVLEEICRELPKLTTFVTLSPVPGFAQWLARKVKAENSPLISASDRVVCRADGASALVGRPGDLRQAGRPTDARGGMVRSARPHEAWHADDSVARSTLEMARGWNVLIGRRHVRRRNAQAHGLMVNYLYDLDEIEKNDEAYAEATVVASGAVQRLLRPPLELVPIAGQDFPYTGAMPPRDVCYGEARNKIVAATSSTFGEASKWPSALPCHWREYP